jgi:hypothetical protein
MEPDAHGALLHLANFTQMIILDSMTMARRRRLLMETKRDLDVIRSVLDLEGSADSERAPSA